MADKFEEEPPTSALCPVPDCEQGMRTVRYDRGTGYAIYSCSCFYCHGTGLVTPARYAAYQSLTRRAGHLLDPDHLK